MPSGKVHSALTLATVSGVIAPYAVVNLGGNPYLYILGGLVGVLITPDLDVDAGMHSDTIIRRISPSAQWLWRTFWTPYSKYMPHRGIYSHFPVLGTLIRIGYILLGVNLVGVVWWMLMRIVAGIDSTVSFTWIWDWSFVAGLCHVDAVHWAADQTIQGKEQYEENNSGRHRRRTR